MNFFRKFFNFWKNLFILIWETIKTMKTVRGLIALFLSFMIFVGWAYVLIVLGMIMHRTALTAIGTVVALFWAGPFTPLIPITLLVAFLIQRYILRDKSNDDALKTAIKNFKENKFQEEDDISLLNTLKIKFSFIHRYKKIYIKQTKRGFYEYK